MADLQLLNFNATTPAPAPSSRNVTWAVTGRNVQAYMPYATVGNTTNNYGVINLPPADGYLYIMRNGNWTRLS